MLSSQWYGLAGDNHVDFSKSTPDVYRVFQMGIVSSGQRSEFESAKDAGKSILVKSGKWSDG